MANNLTSSWSSSVGHVTLPTNPDDGSGQFEPSPKEWEFKFDDERQRIILACIFCLIAFIGTFGNSLVVLAVLFSRKLRTTTNVFVVSLAAADLLTCVFLPFNVVSILSFEEWPIHDCICVIAAVVMYTCVGCSVYTLAAIALNRYTLITRSLHVYRRFFSTPKTIFMVAITWLLPLFYSLIPVMFGLGELGYDSKYSTCTHKTSHPLSDYYSIVQAVVIYPVPLAIITLCYASVFMYVRNHAKSITEGPDNSTSSHTSHSQKRRESALPNRSTSVISRRQIQITQNLFYVVCAFVICITPYCLSLIVPRSEPVIPWAGALILVNSCINPLIYGTKHPQFKRVMGSILTCRLRNIPEPAHFLRATQSRFTPR
ncbi:putative 5-hydroxytryptamine receptor 4-like [Apostichopus japonicus]|uniref:Putative 5-hydroxytryptamine receptor 4-like n=1 Tax=Stichopus japonicus TaxID=307972 RepID=A0A2G8KPA9_STIJA|nr:putative 5-hydroxytryptamine receptor 4-like [Apostichopus japonicus]